MIVDAKSLPAGEEITTQICIIGAGAAGLTMACELAGTNLQVCLLEAGGYEKEDDAQDLYAGEIVGHNYFQLEDSRQRSFGGSTNLWAGYCRPLDAIDFEARDYIPDSGWPFSRAALDPFYERAQKLCQVGKYAFDAESWRDAPRKPFALDPTKLVSEVIQVGPPTKFGEAYRDKVESASNIKVVLHANVTDIRTDGPKVKELRVATLDGKTFTVKADVFVLATGGIENVRLLLSANSQHTAGIGNSHGNVGRYFMDHPVIWNASYIETSERRPEAEFYSVEQPVDGTKVVGFFSPTPEVQRKEKLLNCGILLAPVDLAAQSPGVSSAKHFIRSVRNGQFPEHFGKHAGRILGDIGGLAAGAYRKIFKPLPNQFHTRFWSECAPDADSRITLGNETDALGLRRVKLDWRVPAELERTYRRAHELLDGELRRQGIGRMTIGMDGSVEKALSHAESSYHHMGATRMHESPRKGVVDANSKVHDVNNLFIAGSSVFPTYGHINPTLTIVALAVRLADHIKQECTAPAYAH